MSKTSEENIQMFVNDLTVIDFSYLHPERAIVGESLIVDLILEGVPDDEGMLMDFGKVKKQVKHVIDNSVDHSFVVPKKITGLQILDQGKYLIFKDKFEYKAPLEATTYLDSDVVTNDAICDYLYKKLQAVIPDNVQNIRLNLRSEIIEGAFYHYSHGLKKHDGNCQRIVHGHRSSIIVKKNNTRNRLLENQIASIFKDIYIGTSEDITNRFIKNDIAYISFGYKSSQGDFELTICENNCYLIDEDSTIEYIALHLAGLFAEQNLDNTIEIQAFEGVNKGAMATKLFSSS